MSISRLFPLLQRWFSQKSPILWRALLCWGLGCLLLVNDEVKSFDLRFQLRGPQPVAQDIVIIKIQPEELMANHRLRGRLSTWKDVVDVTDSFYWDPTIWTNLIAHILSQGPKSIGVTLFFSENLRGDLTPLQQDLFQDPRIFWASPMPGGDRTALPLFADATLSNIGIFDLIRDEDGIIRRFSSGPIGFPHLAEKVAGVELSERETKLINFRGEANVFPVYSLSEVVDGYLNGDIFKDKIVLIGAETSSNSQFLTPLGPSYRAAVTAQIVDNLVAERWVKRAPVGFYMLGLLGILILTVLTLVYYPQSVALFLLTWLCTLIAALSVWVFDSHAMWLPILSPVLQVVASWIIFLGYQANKIERQNYELQQERRSLQELEQLKNNFISLISHDLKTPIAKSQAVVDRLMAKQPPTELGQDLGLLRDYTDELNKYIQSILKLLRVESRNFKVNKELGDINESIEAVIKSLKPLADQKNIHIESVLEPLFTFEGDFTLLREVIANLIENAIKYTGAGGEVRVYTTEEAGQVLLRVVDTGPGIPADELRIIWEKFTRGRDQDLKTKGTGLGLYLVKYFIELHRGEVNVESVLGKGTTFTVKLPLESDEEIAEKEGGPYGSKSISAHRG